MLLQNYANVIEAAKKLRIHQDTVKRLIRQGDLPATKIHNTWLIERTKLELFSTVYQPKRGRKIKLL